MLARFVLLASLLALTPACGETSPSEAEPTAASEPSDVDEAPAAAEQPTVPGRRGGESIVRALAGRDAGSHVGPGTVAPGEPLLPPLAEDTERWWPAPAAGERLAPEELTRRPDAALTLGAEGGGWLRVLPVRRNGDVQVSAELIAEGLPADGGGRLTVLELVREPDPAALHELPELLTALHHSEPVGGSDTRRVELTVSVRGATRFVGVLLSQPHAVPGASLRVGELTVRRPGLLEQARALLLDTALWEQPDAVPVADTTIRHVTRPSVLLLPGARSDLPVRLPEGPSRLSAWLGLVPHNDFDKAERVEFVLALHDPATPEAEPLWSRTVPLRSQGRLAARWQALDVPVPAPLRGRALTLRATLDGRQGARVLGALAEPRVIPERPARPGPNVVVISLDTLRADRLGCYGYDARPTSPRLDALAAEASVFLDTWTQAPYTLPSHVSLFSGQFPSVHGVRMHLDRPHPEATTLLAEWLLERGWSTGAFTAGGYVSPDFGFARGFQRYGSLEPLANLESERVVSMIERYPGTSVEMFAEQQWDAVLGWIDDHADESFLLFAHSYTVHQFDPPLEDMLAVGLDPGSRAANDELQTWLTRFEAPPEDVLARIDGLYDATVHQADAAVGRLLDHLQTLGLDDETVVVVTSDHGKELGERGLVAHGHSLHEELLQVPLIVKIPGRPARRVESPAMLVDVLPTLCEALGLPTPPGIQGVPLTGELDPRRVLYAEVDDLAVLRALRQGRFKTIHAPLDAEAVHANTVEERSYDLAADPHERHPLPGDPDRLERLRQFREGLEALRASLGGAAGDGSLSPAMAEHLRQLGYLVGDG